MVRYLTKSRFKLASECETKLFYTKKEAVYADQQTEDKFLESLAEGGFQVGTLAKYYFSNDPVADNITIETLNYEESLAETQRRINAGATVIAEAAFRHDNLFIRTDILQISTDRKEINLFEVKAKSYSSHDNFCSYDKKTGEVKDIISTWKPYLMDVAFQKFVLAKCYPGYSIKAFLTMANKESVATVEGLNQFFKIDKSNGQVKVKITEGLNRQMLGEEILIHVPVDAEVQLIWESPLETGIGNKSFAEYIDLISEKYRLDEKIITPLGSKCKKCQYRLNEMQKQKDLLKSGLKECWQKQTGMNDGEFDHKPLVTELWCGGFRGMNGLIENGIYKLEDVTNEMLAPQKERAAEKEGLSPLQRRLLQIEKAKNNDGSIYLDKEGLRKEMDTWTWPLHMIDFETSRVAIPFHSGRRPYEQIAFQFSHHILQENGTIEHVGEYISFEPGAFPNYDFVRALKRELENDNGSIFRYHNHENNVLNDIYDQMENDEIDIPDVEELKDFIKTITHRKEVWTGDRDMIDLYKLVTKYYYPPAAGGSNSLKYILPATIKASDFLQRKYSQPVYGSIAMPSKNYTNKIWLETKDHFNPYKALPAVFEEYDEEILDSMFEGFDEVAEGGAAMTAYAKLQFGNVPVTQRERLRDALLKYCELDTLAMVMIWEFWNESLKN